MNSTLETLATHCGGAPNDPIPTASLGRIRLSTMGHVLVQVRPLINAVFGHLEPEALDLRALYTQMSGKSDRDAAKRIDGKMYRHYGALKAALHALAFPADSPAAAALAAYPWQEREDEMIEAASNAMKAETEGWVAKAERAATAAETLRAKKRAFDEAFAAAPSGPQTLVERPAKIARRDADEASVFSSAEEEEEEISSSSSSSADAYAPDSASSSDDDDPSGSDSDDEEISFSEEDIA
jgi:hypothetical protein